MFQDLENRLRRCLPTDVTYGSVRLVVQRAEEVSVRRNVVEPVRTLADAGAMVTIWERGGVGYAATADLSDTGLAAAVDRARTWAGITAGIGVLAEPPHRPAAGEYRSSVERSWDDTTLAERVDLMAQQSAALAIDERIVDWTAALTRLDVDSGIVATDGTRIVQELRQVRPHLQATAYDGTITQTRTHGGWAFMGQGGLEVLDRFGFAEAAPRIADEALELLAAPNCPTGTMDLVLAPDQMILQIHESIGHPLELDRILGDERNYAGTSFVTLDMFGSYRYGSELLNVTFDPTVDGQLASYAFDDEATPAERQHLISEGVLLRPLGGAGSQVRARLAGVASARASSWNRPPIDRMANLNLEPGESSFDDLVGSIERGVYLETNNSWSIDDSRNKFQFGCERGRLIEDGRLTTVVRNPGYRGVSATFWRNLTGVGDADSRVVMGVPNCGKGEPNQQIWVGHASPPCRFADVQVFGGDR